MVQPNNSIVTNTDIGTGAAALVCTTTYTPCCSSANQETQWYIPNGSHIYGTLNLPYQRNRGRFPGRVILSRNSENNTAGIFHCDILDASGVTQSLYVGIYTGATGESSTLSEMLVICKEISSIPDKDSIFQVFQNRVCLHELHYVWHTYMKADLAFIGSNDYLLFFTSCRYQVSLKNSNRSLSNLSVSSNHMP